jgi:toxin YoeB
MRKNVVFELSAFEDLRNWAKFDRQIYRKITVLIKQVANSSSVIAQKAQPLKRELNGYWSIKIDEEHRLVYKETKNTIIIVACRYHYF